MHRHKKTPPFLAELEGYLIEPNGLFPFCCGSFLLVCMKMTFEAFELSPQELESFIPLA
jgi:hypothetical protein